MRGGGWKLGAENSGADHSVSMAQGGYGNFDEEVMRAEGVGCRYVVDFVGFVELYIILVPVDIGGDK